MEFLQTGPFTIVFHGMEPDWIEEEMDDDPDFQRDVLELRIKKLFKDEVRWFPPSKFNTMTFCLKLTATTIVITCACFSLVGYDPRNPPNWCVSLHRRPSNQQCCSCYSELQKPQRQRATNVAMQRSNEESRSFGHRRFHGTAKETVSTHPREWRESKETSSSEKPGKETLSIHQRP